MVEEQGTVVECKGALAMIRAQRTSSCDSCASKKACAGGSAFDMLLEADNSVGAKAGDRVVFTAAGGSVLKAGVVLYLVPVLFFIGGIVLGQAVGKAVFPGQNQDLVSGVFGVAFLALAFFGIKLYGKILEKNRSYRPRILRVV